VNVLATFYTNFAVGNYAAVSRKIAISCPHDAVAVEDTLYYDHQYDVAQLYQLQKHRFSLKVTGSDEFNSDFCRDNIA